MLDPLSYFSFQPMIHDWYSKGHGMWYPVCGMARIKDNLLLIGKSSLHREGFLSSCLSGHLPYVRRWIRYTFFSGSLTSSLPCTDIVNGCWYTMGTLKQLINGYLHVLILLNIVPFSPLLIAWCSDAQNSWFEQLYKLNGEPMMFKALANHPNCVFLQIWKLFSSVCPTPLYLPVCVAGAVQPAIPPRGRLLRVRSKLLRVLHGAGRQQPGDRVSEGAQWNHRRLRRGKTILTVAFPFKCTIWQYYYCLTIWRGKTILTAAFPLTVQSGNIIIV